MTTLLWTLIVTKALPYSVTPYPAKIEATLLVVQALKDKLVGFETCRYRLEKFLKSVQKVDNGKSEKCNLLLQNDSGPLNYCMNNIKVFVTKDVAEVDRMLEVLKTLRETCR